MRFIFRFIGRATSTLSGITPANSLSTGAMVGLVISGIVVFILGIVVGAVLLYCVYNRSFPATTEYNLVNNHGEELPYKPEERAGRRNNPNNSVEAEVVVNAML